MSTTLTPSPGPVRIVEASTATGPRGKVRVLYPWSVLAPGEAAFIPRGIVLAGSVAAAVSRRNQVNAERGQPARFTLLPQLVRVDPGARLGLLVHRVA